MRWQDVPSQALYAGSHQVALLIGECAVVVMHGHGEIIRGAYKLLDFMSEA